MNREVKWEEVSSMIAFGLNNLASGNTKSFTVYDYTVVYNDGVFVCYNNHTGKSIFSHYIMTEALNAFKAIFNGEYKIDNTQDLYVRDGEHATTNIQNNNDALRNVKVQLDGDEYDVDLEKVIRSGCNGVREKLGIKHLFLLGAHMNVEFIIAAGMYGAYLDELTVRDSATGSETVKDILTTGKAKLDKSIKLERIDVADGESYHCYNDLRSMLLTVTDDSVELEIHSPLIDVKVKRIDKDNTIAVIVETENGVKKVVTEDKSADTHCNVNGDVGRVIVANSYRVLSKISDRTIDIRREGQQ